MTKAEKNRIRDKVEGKKKLFRKDPLGYRREHERLNKLLAKKPDA